MFSTAGQRPGVFCRNKSSEFCFCSIFKHQTADESTSFLPSSLLPSLPPSFRTSLLPSLPSFLPPSLPPFAPKPLFLLSHTRTSSSINRSFLPSFLFVPSPPPTPRHSSSFPPPSFTTKHQILKQDYHLATVTQNFEVCHSSMK